MIRMPSVYTFDRVRMRARLLSGHASNSRSQISGDLLDVRVTDETYWR